MGDKGNSSVERCACKKYVLERWCGTYSDHLGSHTRERCTSDAAAPSGEPDALTRGERAENEAASPPAGRAAAEPRAVPGPPNPPRCPHGKNMMEMCAECAKPRPITDRDLERLDYKFTELARDFGTLISEARRVIESRAAAAEAPDMVAVRRADLLTILRRSTQSRNGWSGEEVEADSRLRAAAERAAEGPR